MNIHLWPAPGRSCPMPENGGALLPAEGAKVPRNAYWQRRINDGDALETEPVVPAADSPAPADPNTPIADTPVTTKRTRGATK